MEIERKFLIEKLPDLSKLKPIPYERYYLEKSSGIEKRIQKKDDKFEFEELTEKSDLSRNKYKKEISVDEYNKLKLEAIEKPIIRDGYNIELIPKTSIKIYHGDFEGLQRVKVEFESEDEANNFEIPDWFGIEITNSLLGRDSRLVSLSNEEFNNVLNTYNSFAERIENITKDCCLLYKQTLNSEPKSSGNIGIFGQDENEYKSFLKVRNDLVKPSANPNQKYYELINPIKIEIEQNIKAIYTHLYIRKPDSTPYGKYLGDIDFIMSDDNYRNLKNAVLKGKFAKGVEVYNRPGWDNIQITDESINSVAYVCTKEFAEKVRVKFD